MMSLFDNPAFGIALTLLLYALGVRLNGFISRYRMLSFLNPLLLALSAGILFLAVTGIPLASFQKGGSFLSFFLGPCVVILALPLYRNRHLIHRHALPIVCSVAAASLVSIVSVILISRALRLDEAILRSMLGKSTTTPIALELAGLSGGNASLSVLGVMLTGNLGAMMSQTLFRLLRIDHPVAAGLALGTASHAIGTATAFSLGETEGAMAGLAIGISGLMTVLWLPVVMFFFRL